MLIEYIKIPAVLKNQRFKDNRSDKTELKGSKCQQLNVHDNESGQCLDEYEVESKDNRYILLLFKALFLLQKKLNRLSDLGEKTISLNHLVCISKIG